MQSLFSLPKIVPEINVDSLRLEFSVDNIRNGNKEWIHIAKKKVIESISKDYEDELASNYTNLTETTEILRKIVSEYKELLKEKGIQLVPKLSKEYPTPEHYILNQIKDTGKKIEKFLTQGLEDVDKIIAQDDPELSSLAFLWKFAFYDSLNAITYINKGFSSLDLKRIWRRKGRKELNSILEDYYYLYVLMIPTFTKIMNHISLMSNGRTVNDEQKKLFIKQASLLTTYLYRSEIIHFEEENQ